MKAAISGYGWITPLGADLDEVWNRMAVGETGEVRELTLPGMPRCHFHMPVPAKLVEKLGRTPRLRRSSVISYYTAAAGLAALEHAGLAMTPETAAKTGVVFAIASGGVVYTRRFYQGIVANGAQTASPLLFPETVYNAPASHLAALMGIDGMSYTLVGDASVGIAALVYAQQLLATTELEHVLVIGGEEADWIMNEAYSEWGLLAGEPRLQVYHEPPLGTVLAEGAAAVVVSREGRCKLSASHAGQPFFRRAEAEPALRTVVTQLLSGGLVDLVVSAANGTFIDRTERKVFDEQLPDVPVYAPKVAFGEALGAGALLQVVTAAVALERGERPGVEAGPFSGRRVLVPVLGWNQHAAGVVVER